MARLKKRKDNRYQTQINVYDENGERVLNSDGKPKRKSVYGRTRPLLEENVQKAKDYEKKKSNPAFFLTVNEWADKWFIANKSDLAYNTRSMYDLSINTYIKPVLGNLRLQDVGVAEIEDLLNTHKEKGHKRTAQIIYITISQMLESARKRKYINENPILDVDRPHYKRPKKRAFTKNEIRIITNVELNLKQKAFLLMLFRTGVRICELIALNLSDVDLEGKNLFIRKSIYFEKNRPVLQYDRTKTEAGIRKIPLLDDLIPTLKEYIESMSADNDILFPSAHGGYMSRSACRCFWRQINNWTVQSSRNNVSHMAYLGHFYAM